MGIFVIWKNEEDHNVADVNDVVGLFEGTYQEADKLLQVLNEGDPSVQAAMFGRVRYGYWRAEYPWITMENVKEFIPN